MSSLLYITVSSGLSEEELIKIDKQIFKNRKEVYLFIRNLPSNSKRKAKRVFLYATFVFQLGQPLVPYAAAVMIPLPPVAIHRLSPIEQDIILSNKNGYPQIATIPESKLDKIRLTNDQIQQFNNLALQLNNGSIKMEEAVLQLRGGELSDIVGVIAFVIFINWYDSLFGVEAFQANPLPHQDPFGWLSGKYDSKNVGPSGSRSTTFLEMEKPASMPQIQYSALTKSEKRQLTDPKGRDGFLQIGDYPRLNVRFNQVEYKTPKHGKDHGLPVDKTGKTPKTEANAIALRDSLVDMPNSQDILWYTDGQYQGGTQRGCDSVNLFDPNRNLIAVYQKQPDGSYSFLTTCKLVPAEVKHLQDSNGNFLTEKMINQQSAVSIKIHDSTNTKNDL
jgi:hypothetical protein